MIVPLPPRPPPQPTPPGFRTDLHCAYHQRAGHDTDSCAALRHAIQDLIDQGLVDLGRPAVTTDPLLTHDTRAVPPPPGGVHLIEYSGDEIFMMGWDGEAPQPICLYADTSFSGYTHGQQIMFRHIRGKMTCAFRKRVKPRKFQKGDLVLKVLRGLINDPRGKFRTNWSGPYVIRDLTQEGAAWLTDLDGNKFTEPVNVDQLKRFYA